MRRRQILTESGKLIAGLLILAGAVLLMLLVSEARAEETDHTWRWTSPPGEEFEIFQGRTSRSYPDAKTVTTPGVLADSVYSHEGFLKGSPPWYTMVCRGGCCSKEHTLDVVGGTVTVVNELPAVHDVTCGLAVPPVEPEPICPEPVVCPEPEPLVCRMALSATGLECVVQ